MDPTCSRPHSWRVVEHRLELLLPRLETVRTMLSQVGVIWQTEVPLTEQLLSGALHSCHLSTVPHTLLSFPTIHFHQEQPDGLGPGSVIQCQSACWFKSLTASLGQREKRRREMRPKFISILEVIFKERDAGGREHMSVS